MLFRSALVLLATSLGVGTRPLLAQDTKPGDGKDVGVVSFVKVLSDKVQDVSSLEAIQKSFIKEGMSDKEKAFVIYDIVTKFRQESSPPQEFLQRDKDVHDTVKMFNVYGYNMCCCTSCNVEQIARFIGLEARGWSVPAHSVPEVRYDNGWHMFDPEWICYFPDAKGNVLGVEELLKDVGAWMEKHPELKGNLNKVRDFAKGGGWKQGPDSLVHYPLYNNNGNFANPNKGFLNPINSYGQGKGNLFEYGYSQGYQVNNQLRRGEKLTRNWFNKGLHINQPDGSTPSCLKGRADNMKYQAEKLGDLAPGRVGNGTLEYDVPLADGGFRQGAWSAENLASQVEDQAGPALHVKDPAAKGMLVIRMPSSYVYLGGEVTGAAVVGEGGSITVSLSDNNGLDWKEVAKVDKSGDMKLDLKPLVYRRYDYRLKFDLAGQGTGLERLKISNDIQHSQAPLPALGQGENQITFSAGPAESTLTIEGNSDPAAQGKQLTLASFHPVLEGMKIDALRTDGSGSAVFPVSVPGDIVRIRMGAHYRARGANDSYTLDVSFDGGRTFQKIGNLTGPTAADCKYFTFSDVPAGAKAAQIRISGSQKNTIMMMDTRIDVDYKQPNGGFRPVKITYLWEENGQEKTDQHIARSAQESYSIKCADKPAMKSIVLELAD